MNFNFMLYTFKSFILLIYLFAQYMYFFSSTFLACCKLQCIYRLLFILQHRSQFKEWQLTAVTCK